MSLQLTIVKRHSYLRRASLRVLIGAVGGVLALVCLFGYSEILRQSEHASEDLGVLAEVIAISTPKDTSFDASSGAQPPKAWSSVRFHPDLAAAAVFGPTGELVWGWQRGADWTVSAAGEALKPFLGPPYHTLERSMRLREGSGRVVLSWSASVRGPGLAAQVLPLALLCLTLVGILLVAVRSLQERLLLPVEELTVRASQAISDRHFALQLTTDNPETAEVANTFNLILHEVLERDQELARTLQGFEQEVSERTEELLQVNAELTRTRSMAEEAVVAKSTILAKVSHEIRTPMNAVVGMAALLMETDLDEDQHSMAEKVVRSSGGLLSILNDILDFSKIEAGKLELEEIDFSPREIIEDVCDLVSHAAQDKGLKVGSFVHPDVPATILGDPSRLRQIVLNFAGNAVKFTHEGVVIIELSYECSISGGSELRLEVRDTGVGIAPEAQGLIFEPFSQAERSTSRAYGGTGLGLAIAQQLALLMRGAVGVQSVVGEGSTFWARVWLRDSVGRAAHAKALVPNRRGLRALIIDESAAIAEVCQRELDALGCYAHVETSTSGAFEELSRGGAYDILLLDSQLPGKDAFFGAIGDPCELAKVPVVLLVPGFQTPESKQPKNAQVFGTIRRPIKRADLLEVLEKATGLRVSEPQVAKPDVKLDLIPDECGSKARILLVEDNQTNQQLVQYILAKGGYPVDVVDNGIKALEAYGEGDYDLILMDCQMPLMDGFEATRRIRSFEEADGGHVPILAMTANAMDGDREKCMEAGMDDYIAKPIQPRDMLAWMEDWLDRRDVQEFPSAAKQPELVDARPTAAPAGFAAPTAPGAQARTPEHEPTVLLPATDKASPERALDPMILGCLRDGDPVGEELALELIQIYMATAPESMNEIERLVLGEDWEECARVAHKFVSSNGTIGAMEFAQLLRRMEGACREGLHEDARAMAAQGRVELERALEELRAMD